MFVSLVADIANIRYAFPPPSLTTGPDMSAAHNELPPLLPTRQDAELARTSSRLLAACIGQGPTARLRVIDGEDAIEVPVAALRMLVDILANMAEGNAISLVPGGLAAGLLSTLPIGASVPASGPLGRFCLNPGDRNRRDLLLATGTGVSPYRAMLPALIERMQQGLEVVLLHGARTADELPYAGEFLALAAAQPRFEYLPCVSRQWPVDLPAACQGHVQEQLARLKPDPAHDIAYLCGNPAMIDAGFALLRAAGFGMPRLRREKYLSLSGQAAGA